MGTRNRDRLHRDDWRRGHEFAGEMLADNWEVLARCLRCERRRIVNLRLLVRYLGPLVILWNRKTPCRAFPPCGGFEVFEARPPGAVAYFTLEGRDPPA